MTGESRARARVRELLWRDVMEWASDWGTVVRSDESQAILVTSTYGLTEVLKFGPKEWAQFVYRGLEDEVDLDIYDARLSGYALDDLWETLGSKGSPIVIRNGELERE